MTPVQVMLTAFGATGLLWLGTAVVVRRIVAVCSREEPHPAARQADQEPLDCHQLMDDISSYLRFVRHEP